jgi:(5-formylfuran-3-yl)methyl phosphate synthase
MAGLLVSVRSADEARAALRGGASVIDIKEPDRGPLGRADESTWSAVRSEVSDSVPISVALGELSEWADLPVPHRSAFDGLSFRKLGLAGSGPRWADEWSDFRDALEPGPEWVAVAYADWTIARSPRPDVVLDEAIGAGLAGILVDTWKKADGISIDASWRSLIERAHAAGLFVALAGGLDVIAIRRLFPLRPDLFAVRGAACVGGRGGSVKAQRVAALVDAASAPSDSRAGHRSLFTRAAEC